MTEPEGPRSVEEVATSLLAQENLGEPTTISRIGRGHNNRVYKVQSGSGTFLLKRYYQGGPDGRDRCEIEYRFLSILWDQGIRAVPKPQGREASSGSALYEYVEGDPIDPSEVNPARIRQALAFLEELKDLGDAQRASDLPMAAEACRSLDDHLATVGRRLSRLRSIESRDDLDREMHEFLQTEVQPQFEEARDRLLAWAEERELDPSERLSDEELILSPSDFGFHNALEEPDGTIRFLDFEYAGWDDPAKLLSDFVTQLTHPIPTTILRRHLDTYAARLDSSEAFPSKVSHLAPIHRLKWCLIALNEFLSRDAKRRSFAREERHDSNRRRIQLAKARDAFEHTDWNTMYDLQPVRGSP